MAGALWTSYDASFPAIWVEAMKRRSKAGGKPAKSRPSKSLKLKRSSVPKAAHRRAATQQTASWLEKLGLGQYAKCFAENDITVAILRDLTDQDLKELGVASLGHRRELLQAIAELRAVEKGPPKPAPAVAPPVTQQDAAERRQVTVLFSDLVGSTALSSRMDPEDLREVISAYQKCVAETVQRFGGFVAKYMGDGVLVYFGYPHAHEDDAERAVRAGLELVAAVNALKTRAPLQNRVGISTGLVVVGDLIGTGSAQEQAVVGETPNLAARLQVIAEPNTVVISDSTRRLLGNLFEFEDLGAEDLKGISAPMRAWAALRPSAVEGRFEALHASGLTALVGREEELELLLRRWSKANGGEGQVVLLSGEAGIGKSRLTAALLERLTGEPHTRLRYFCSPQHTDSAFYPIISQMERAAGFVHDDIPQARLDKLDMMLAQTSTSKQDAALFAEMLSLPNDGRYPAIDLTPEQRRHRTLEALTTQVAKLASQRPVLMIFEDTHWTDPTSLEAFGRTVDQIKTLPALLIVTFRPEFNAPWAGRSHVTSVALNRLGERETAAIIARLVGNKELPSDVMAEIVERTDGIPLFVEEMTKAVLEAEGEGEGAARRTVAAVPSPTLAVPASLHASLMARLDRLGPAKEVAQIGAAIGREFSHALLAAVVHKPEAELGAALDRLMAAGLLFRQGVPPYASYLFKHALVQDAAYGTLLREPRKALHGRIAETLESQFTEIAENQPELIARHCTEAELIEKATEFWGKAGQRSLQRSAAVEASEHLTRAVNQIALLSSSAALRHQEITFQVALANALMHTKGYAAFETKSAFDQARLLMERARSLGDTPEDPLLLFSILYGFWVSNLIAFNGDALRELATQFLTLAEKQTATGPIMIGHRLMASSLVFTGDIVRGAAHYDKALALYDPAKHRALATRFGQDVGVVILSFRAWTLWFLGYPDRARTDIEGALTNSREIGHAATSMYALNNAIGLHIHWGNYEDANSFDHDLMALAEETNAPYWKGAGIAYRGWLSLLTGNPSAAVDAITSGITTWRSTGATYSMHSAFLARAYAMNDQFDNAWRCIHEAMTAAETTKFRWCEAEVHRAAGEIELMSPQADTTRAEQYFERALTIARAQQAKSWELRAAMSMARLRRDQDKRDEARELLAPVYGWFTEGFDTLDLKEAKALLDELAAKGAT
jgi:class 3 adenylate cyclase/predicted ATPase